MPVLPAMRSVFPARVVRPLVALLVVAAGVTVGALHRPGVPAARADEATISGNDLRDGWDSNEPGLSHATVTGGSFGQLFSVNVDGQVYAQPIVVGNTLIVATENDFVYGLNSLTGAVKWKSQLGTAWPSAAEHCNDLTPEVGVTGTPVYDPTTSPASPNGAVYMVSEQVINGDIQHPAFYLHALDPTTGNELPNWPVQIKGAPTNDPTVPFAPFNQLQRPGLLLLNGSVYAAFGSHCDFQPYSGYVVGVGGANAANPRSETMWTDEAGVAATEAGIWQSGGGLMSDGSGRIFFASGNGVSPAPGPGSKPPAQLAEAVVRLAVLGDGSLAAKDFFSPSNAPYLDSIDGDLGSGGPAGLPFGTTSLPDLMVEAGKADGLFVLNRDKLGGRSQGPGGSDAVVSAAGKGLPGQWGHQGAFASASVLTTANSASSKDYVYYVGAHDAMRYFKASLGGSNGVTPILTDVAQSTDSFGYTSGSPVVTSNGTDPTSGIVWIVNSSDEDGTSGTLQAFPVVPSGSGCSKTKPCKVAPLWTSAPFSEVGKFTTPATDNGHVYIGTRGVTGAGANCPTSADYCGQVIGFGSPSRAPLGGVSPVNFGDVPVSTPGGPQDVTLTAAAAVTISSVTFSDGQFNDAGTFEKNGSPATLPVTLADNDTFTVQGVTATPNAPGGFSGALQLSTDSPNFPVVGVGLSGTGTQDGFYASQSSVPFGTVPVGTTQQVDMTVTNGESGPVTLTTTNQPAAPFNVSGLPADGTTISPGQSIPLAITYTPSGTAGDGDSLTLQADDGTIQTPLTINLSGTGQADVNPTLTTSPTGITFGSVPLGHNVTQSIDLTNSGNLPAVVTVTGPPKIPFGAPAQIDNGLPINPGYDVTLPVSFAPTSVGAVSDDYTVTWTDTLGTHQLSVPVTGTGITPVGVAVPPPGGGWTFNGSAQMTGSSLSLNQAVKNTAGSADYSQTVPGNGLNASFTVKLSGGTGANGMTFALLDAASEGQRAVGGAGPELGFGGLNGVAVTLDTSKDGAGYPSNSFVGIATGAAGGLLTFAKTANVAGLRTGTHKIGVTTSGGVVTVTVDGKKVLSASVALPPVARLAFTGGTGAKDDNHVVSGVSITSAGHRIPVPGGGWTYNGSAATSGSDTTLTPVAANKAGSVVYPAPVQAVGLRAVFNIQIGGGSGGDGMTFALLSPSKSSVTTLGSAGPDLGIGTSAGVPGVAIALATDGPKSPAGFVATSVKTGPDGLKYQRKAQGIGLLSAGTHVVAVNVTKDPKLGVVVTIFLDGVQVLQMPEPDLTSMVRLAFTAGTGSATNQHIIRNVAISASG